MERYDEAIAAFEIMLSRLSDTPDVTEIRSKTISPHNISRCLTLNPELRQQYISPSEAENSIQAAIHTQLDNTPHRLLDTLAGRLCNRGEQIHIFKTSATYKELLSSTIKHADLRMEHIDDVVTTYFRCVMLSHRWGENEPRLHDIQDKAVYELDAAGGFMKLQSFCKVARDIGFRWAWIDTCCIDQNNNVELGESVNSMFVWYRHSALTIVYLSDVPPSSKSGALAKSAWNKRGWTVQEFLAPKIVLFYQMDWTLYLDDRSINHKESVMIMQELADATGINAQALVSFRPGMRLAREKLQWVSMRNTTLQEDIAYSLFGIFGVHLPVIYGEKKQNALGRLLQEIVARSGDITALEWVGKSSEFNSCLPADITSYYEAPPCASLSPAENEIHGSVSSSRGVELASELYTLLDNMNAPRFANCRLHLPCIAFRVTTMKLRRGQDQGTVFTYEVKADGLHDLLITTEEKLTPFSRVVRTRQTMLLVLPWHRTLLESSDSEDNTQQDFSVHGLPGDNRPVYSGSRSLTSRLIHRFRHPFSTVFDSLGGIPGEKEDVGSESDPRVLQLIFRLRQPFCALLLAQQRGGEYKRIAPDHYIIAQVNGVASVRDMMDSVRILEIL